MEQFFCLNCQIPLNSSDTTCPKCGSQNRFIGLVDSLLSIERKTCIQNKDLYSGSHKYFFEETVKKDYDFDTQQDTIATRRYNRRNDRGTEEKDYIEEIRTLSGELIKNNSDKLVNHIGHGCDKKNSNDNIDNGDDYA